MEKKYKIKLPRKVVAIDYDEGNLYLRFKHIDKPIGEPSEDFKVIFFYTNGNKIVALEILDVKDFLKSS